MPLDEDPVESQVYDQAPPEIPAAFKGYDPTDTPHAFGVDDKTPLGDAPDEQLQQSVEFNPRWKEEFTGLLFIGALTETFQYLGHKFVIRTLTQSEEIQVGVSVKEYAGTEGYTKAFMMAIAAACTVSVDGVLMPHPITTDPNDTPFQNRLRYVEANWFAPVIDAVYEQYLRLSYTVREVIASLGEASG